MTFDEFKKKAIESGFKGNEIEAAFDRSTWSGWSDEPFELIMSILEVRVDGMNGGYYNPDRINTEALIEANFKKGVKSS